MSWAKIWTGRGGREAAYTAALNALALTKKQLGSLDRVSRVVRLGVYVAATPELTEHAKVADAATVTGHILSVDGGAHFGRW